MSAEERMADVAPNPRPEHDKSQAEPQRPPLPPVPFATNSDQMDAIGHIVTPSITAPVPVPPSGPYSTVPGIYVTQYVPNPGPSIAAIRTNLQLVHGPFNGPPAGNTGLPSHHPIAAPISIPGPNRLPAEPQRPPWPPAPFNTSSDQMEAIGNYVATTITTTVQRPQSGQNTAPQSLIVNKHIPHSAMVPTSGLHYTQTGMYVPSHCTATAPVPPADKPR